MAQSHTVYRWQCWDLRPAGISRFVPVADKLWVWLLSPLWSQIHHLSQVSPSWQKSNWLSQVSAPVPSRGDSLSCCSCSILVWHLAPPAPPGGRSEHWGALVHERGPEETSRAE